MPHIPVLDAMRTSNTLWQEFLATKSAKTRDAYDRGLRFFLEANNYADADAAIEDLRRGGNADERMAAFVRYLRDRKLSPASIALYLSAVRSFLELYDIRANPIKLRKLLPRKRYIRDIRPISRDELATILPLLRPSKRLFVWFCFATGARAGEAARLKVGDLDLDADPPRATIESEKNYRRRVLFIPADLAKALKKWTEGLKPDHYVFYNERGPEHPLDIDHVRHAFQSALSRGLGLRRDRSNRGWQYSLHSLRKAFKTQLTLAGVDGLTIEVLMGHDTGLDRHYYLPTVDELAREWKKGEPFLILETRSRWGRADDDVYEGFETVLAYYRLWALKLIENALIHRKVLGMKGLLNVDVKEIDRRLAIIKREIEELSSKVPERLLKKLDEYADWVS